MAICVGCLNMECAGNPRGMGQNPPCVGCKHTAVCSADHPVLKECTQNNCYRDEDLDVDTDRKA